MHIDVYTDVHIYVYIDAHIYVYRYSEKELEHWSQDPRAEAVRRDRDKLLRVYRTVPRDLFVRIYQMYQPDYDLFGYNMDDILTSVGYEPLTTREREIKHFR